MIKLIDILKELFEEKSKKDILDILEPYSQDPSYFVSFTNIEKIGINPVNKFSTPIGVYCYNLKDLWTDWIEGDDFFGKDRPYVNLLKLNTDKVLYIKDYNLNKKDMSFLEKIYQKHSTPDIPFDKFITQLKSLHNNDSLYQTNTDGGLIWKLTEEIAKIIKGDDSKSFTVVWNKLFRSMGYDVIIDKQSTVHLLQSSQAIFLTPSTYKVIERYHNKLSDSNIKTLDKYWGTDKQPYYRPGPNPTVDLVVKYNEGNTIKILLIKRSPTSKAEPGKWALPGGFHDTNEPIGKSWKPGRESARQAAIRELTEETGLYLANIKDLQSRIKFVGSYEGGNRDPRDNDEAWSKSNAFSIELNPQDNININDVSGRDDAVDAKWFNINSLPALAFDHSKIIQNTL
jgi:8-oxo-dGTP diphosphatase